MASRQEEFDYLNSSDASGNALKIAELIKQSYQISEQFSNNSQLLETVTT